MFWAERKSNPPREYRVSRAIRMQSGMWFEAGEDTEAREAR